MAAFIEPSMEVTYEFEVKDMLVTMDIDTKGEAVHIIGLTTWNKKIHDSMAVGIM